MKLHTVKSEQKYSNSPVLKPKVLFGKLPTSQLQYFGYTLAIHWLCKPTYITEPFE